jgi:tetratricopeptide (TPR) repeat protein
MRPVKYFRNLRTTVFTFLVLLATTAALGLVCPAAADEEGYTQGWMGAPDWLLERMDTDIMPAFYIPKNTTGQTGEVRPTAGSHISEGNNLLISGSYADAKRSFENAINLKPESFDAWTGRGMALEGLKRYQTALDSYEKAISFSDPDEDAAWIAYAGKGRVCYHLADYKTALNAIEEAIERFAGSGESNIDDLIHLYEKLADIEEKLGNEAAASDAREKAGDLRAASENSSS